MIELEEILGAMFCLADPTADVLIKCRGISLEENVMPLF